MNYRSANAVTLLLGSLLLIGCAQPRVVETRIAHQPSRDITPVVSSSIKQKLYQQHAYWQGTPYRLGGLDRSGVDCSGFVYRTFESLFQMQLPRTTDAQAQWGEKVATHRLKPGDLVFFKTGRKLRHVGIYIENQQFLHASTSRGVVISRLDNPYWASRIWKAKRLSISP